MKSESHPAVFLDRDGTINREVDYLSDPSQLDLLPGAAQAIARLQRGGFAIVVITNQSGIARGRLTEGDLDKIHGRLRELLAEEGATLDGIYYCPHHPTEGPAPYRRVCECRKPAPGMLEDAVRDLELDVSRSFAVGDAPRDLRAAAQLGIPGILVESGKPVSEESRTEFDVCADLAAAAQEILTRNIATS